MNSPEVDPLQVWWKPFQENRMAPRRWLVTGTSSGFGRSLAQMVLSRGGRVVAGAQGGANDLDAPPGRLLVLPLELLDPASIGAFVEAAFEHGPIDVIANVAGYGLVGAIEDATDEEVRDAFEVNFFGPLRLIQLALPKLRRQGHGHIVNFTSIAGRAPSAGSGVYAAAKSALEGLSASLAQEVAALNIRVTAVAPGAFRTQFLSTQSIRRSKPANLAYAPSVGRALGVLETIAGQQAGDPERAAAAIIAAVESDEPPRHLLLGGDALRRARSQLEETAAEMARWESVTLGTDHGQET